KVLASQTAEATKEIASRIYEVRRQTSEIVDCIEMMIETIDEAADRSSAVLTIASSHSKTPGRASSWRRAADTQSCVLDKASAWDALVRHEGQAVRPPAHVFAIALCRLALNLFGIAGSSSKLHVQS